jgi:dethiobiotin synthetase/adenosylmethionine--8-amino-7-oxononanoate aminotransferase
MVEEQEEAAQKGEGNWKDAQDLWKPSSVANTSAPQLWSFWDRDFIDRVSRSDKVQGVMTLGTVLAIELREEAQEGFGGT